MPTMPKSTKPAYLGPKLHQSQQLNQKEAQAFYGSPVWRRASYQFKLSNPLCVECLKEGRNTATQITDHIKPISEGADPWDRTNWQPLCKQHHNIKRNEESKRARRGRTGGDKG